MGRVEGKVVAITGAARGQGRSHAVRLAEEGADIIAIDVCEDHKILEYPLASAEDLAETVRLVERTGRRVVSVRVDVRDAAQLRDGIDRAVAELGRLDVVVANAGISPVGPERPVEAFAEVVDVNLNGALNTVHAALPHLADGSSIIVIGSAAGLLTERGAPQGGMGPGGYGYSFAKRTLLEYVNWFAPFLAPKGTRINAVLPANVNTDMLQNDAMYKVFRPDLEAPTRADAELSFPMVQAMPVPYVDPVDVSHAVTYLASDESRYVTGLHLKVDAGAVVQQGK